MAFIKLKFKEEDFYIMGIYRPDRDFDEGMDDFFNVLNKIPTWKSSVIIMCDINVNSLKAGKNEQESSNILSNYNNLRLNLPPTRVTPTSETSIDMIATNLPTNELTTTVLQTFISDHTSQACSINLSNIKVSLPTTIQRNLSEQNLQIIKNLLERQNWDDVYNEISPDAAYNNFIEIVTYYLNYVSPKKKK